MKKLRRYFKLLFLIIIVMMIILLTEGYFPSFVNKLKDIDFEDSISVLNDVDEDEKSEVTPIVLIEDNNVYLNSELINSMNELIDKLDIASSTSKKVKLNSEKAKLNTYNKVMDALEKNEYIIINSDN